MINLNIVLKVTKEEFYDLLMQLLKIDYQASSKRELDDAMIKDGFSYNKHVLVNGEKEMGKLTLNKVIPHNFYQATFSVADHVSVTTYEMEDYRSGMGLKATKQFTPEEKGLKARFNLMKEKSNLKKMIKDMERSILNQKGR